MTSERVGKEWVKQGLGGYSTPAILGTLAHYGVQADEAGFKAAAAEGRSPSSIAGGWSRGWKGTGPFSRYPFAAALELWKRWCPDVLSPERFAQALAELLGALAGLLSGKADAPVAERFEAVRALRAQMKLSAQGEPAESFVAEVLAPFDQRALEAFDSMAEALAQQGHREHALAFAELEEFLLPVRRGVATAVARAAAGEKAEATAALVAQAQDAARAREARLLSVDGLLHLGAFAEGARAAQPLRVEAERAEDWHQALDLCARLQHAYQKLGDREALAALEPELRRLQAAHEKAHPGHHRHGH